MSINGLPLHPLIVHATVVALPVAAVVALAYVVRPAWRERLRWPLLGLAVLSAVLVLITKSSGEDLQHARFGGASGVLADRIHEHEEWADRLGLATYLFAVVVVVDTFLERRSGWFRTVVQVLIALAAVGVLVLVVLTGDAGARASWGQ